MNKLQVSLLSIFSTVFILAGLFVEDFRPIPEHSLDACMACFGRCSKFDDSVNLIGDMVAHCTEDKCVCVKPDNTTWTTVWPAYKKVGYGEEEKIGSGIPDDVPASSAQPAAQAE